MLLVLAVIVLGYLQFKPKPIIIPTVSETETSLSEPVQTTITQNPATQPNQTVVAGMQKYTDESFGFSFWYPSGLSVTKSTIGKWNDINIKDATVIANIDVGNGVNIKQVRSTTRTITNTTQDFGKVTYYFNKDTHLWMTSSDKNPTLVAANINDNTMGGLHLFPGVASSTTVIIPLSANDFVVINGGTSFKVPYIARTVVALDPTVGVIASEDIQTKTIQALKNTFALSSQGGSGTFSDPLNGFSFQYSSESDMRGVYVTKNKTNIDTNGYYVYERGGSVPEPVVINGIIYKLSTFTDCGAGTCGTDHYYTTYRNGAYISIAYVTFTHNCGAVDDQVACEQKQAEDFSKSMKAIEASLGSLKFTTV